MTRTEAYLASPPEMPDEDAESFFIPDAEDIPSIYDLFPEFKGNDDGFLRRTT